MLWATLLTDPSVHILPASEDGHLYPWHEPTPWCECWPTPSRSDPESYVTWTHHDDH